MLCPKCNQPVLDGARFCGSCGQAISPAANPGATLIRPPSSNPGAGAAPGGATAGGATADGATAGGATAGGATAGGAPPSWATATGPLPGLLERVKNILLTPKTEWPLIESEPTSIAKLYTGYIIPLAALVALVSFLRMSVIGFGFGFGTFRVPMLSGLEYALLRFGSGLLGLFLVGLIIDALAPTFSGQRNQRQALKIAAYAFTAGAAGSVLALVPVLGVLLALAAAVYSIYLLYLGLPLLMRSPREKAGGYTAAVVICAILLGIVLALVLRPLTGGFGGYGRYGALSDAAMTPEQRQQRAAAAVGAIIGGALGTDDKGKAGLSAAINNLAAAGQKMEQQQQATANSGAQPAASSDAGATAPANAQNAAAATAGLLSALGGAMGGNRRVDPVDFRTLKALLPDSLPGMQRTNAEGSSQQAVGVKGSQATGDYQGPAGAHAEIKIVDASGVSGLLNLAGSMVQNRTSESDSGYEKDTTIGNQLMHEKYDSKAKHGELSAIIAKRFAVNVTGDGVEMNTLEQYASLVDFSRLEAMKDAGVQSP